MAAMLQIPRVLPRVSCVGSAKAVQCPRPGSNIGDKSQQIPRYSPLCPRGQPSEMAADKCVMADRAPKLLLINEEGNIVWREAVKTLVVPIRFILR